MPWICTLNLEKETTTDALMQEKAYKISILKIDTAKPTKDLWLALLYPLYTCTFKTLHSINRNSLISQTQYFKNDDIIFKQRFGKFLLNYPVKLIGNTPKNKISLWQYSPHQLLIFSGEMFNYI